MVFFQNVDHCFSIFHTLGHKWGGAGANLPWIQSSTGCSELLLLWADDWQNLSIPRVTSRKNVLVKQRSHWPEIGRDEAMLWTSLRWLQFEKVWWSLCILQGHLKNWWSMKVSDQSWKGSISRGHTLWTQFCLHPWKWAEQRWDWSATQQLQISTQDHGTRAQCLSKPISFFSTVCASDARRLGFLVFKGWTNI